MLIGVCSDKGSPGATTTALTLASVWPTRALVVEADPNGGDLAIRLRTKDGAALPEAPTVLTVAAAARTTGSPDLTVRYAHRLTEGVSVSGATGRRAVGGGCRVGILRVGTGRI